MDVGKLPAELLAQLLDQVPQEDPRVVLGPRPGEDAAAIDMGDRLLVAATDPVTLASDMIGWYAVQVNANDIACRGAVPRWFLASLLLPTTATPQMASEIFQQITTACKDLDVTLIGGHTEISRGIDRPILVGSMLGEVEKGKLVTTAGARPGDSIVITKGIAIEGAALLAREASERLENLGVDQSVLASTQELLLNPGISVVAEALVACRSVPVHCMHDPTEGGLATGLWEVAQAAGVGVAVELGSVPVLPQCQEICQAAGLDPLGLLASGCLIITLPPEEVPRLLSALEGQGIDGYEIGQVTEAEEGVKMLGSSHELEDLPRFSRDEVARFLD